MACLHVSRSGFLPSLGLRSGLPSRRFARPASLRLRSRLQEDNNDSSNGEGRPESLFMKELRRRGMTPTSLLEESGRKALTEEGAEGEEEVGGGGQRTRRNGVASADYEKATANQRERSMALNSEGLEGLFPRAKLLLTIGGTFFIGFWPLILMTFVSFGALYLYFGPTFVHDASKMPAASPPPYIDPYTLLEDEGISKVAPYVK